MSYANGIRYPKIKRLPLYPVPYRKDVLSDADIELLFSDEVVIEEKIDGKLSYEDTGDYIIFYEFMRVKHEIHYSSLPSYKIAFDVYHKNSGKFLGFPEKHRFLKSSNWCYTPVIYVGKNNISSWKEELLKLMKRPSLYGAPLIEGVVIKNYSKQFFAKAINKEFDEAIREKEHYIRRRKTEENKIYYGENWDKICYPNKEYNQQNIASCK